MKDHKLICVSMQLVLSLNSPVACNGCSNSHLLSHSFISMFLHQADASLYHLLFSSGYYQADESLHGLLFGSEITKQMKACTFCCAAVGSFKRGCSQAADRNGQCTVLPSIIVRWHFTSLHSLLVCTFLLCHSSATSVCFMQNCWGHM